MSYCGVYGVTCACVGSSSRTTCVVTSEPIISEHTIRVEWGDDGSSVIWPSGHHSNHFTAWLVDICGITRPKPVFVPQPGEIYTQCDETPVRKGWKLHRWCCGEWVSVEWFAFNEGDRWMLQPPPPEPVAKAEPVSLWRSVAFPPATDTFVWVCGGARKADAAWFGTGSYPDREYWAPYVEGQPMPPLPPGIES